MTIICVHTCVTVAKWTRAALPGSDEGGVGPSRATLQARLADGVEAPTVSATHTMLDARDSQLSALAEGLKFA